MRRAAAVDPAADSNGSARGSARAPVVWALALCALVGLAIAAAPAARAQSVADTGCRIEARAKCAKALLRGRNLRRALLELADLGGADLAAADLTGALLWKTRLEGADLTGARLAQVFLTGADLRGANLRDADLSQAFLFGAFTDGADFTGARLDGARWIDGTVCAPNSIGRCVALPPDAPAPVPFRDFGADW